jgi:hypothetical protein
MIAAVATLAAALAQPAPAAQPSFAILCRLDATMTDASKVDPLPEVRKLGMMISQDSGDKYAPRRTFDPSSILGGREIKMFRRRVKDGVTAYGGFTSLPAEDPGAMIVSLTPSDSKKYNEWIVAVGPVTHKQGEALTIGRCLLLDGVTEAMFPQLTEKFVQQSGDAQ